MAGRYLGVGLVAEVDDVPPGCTTFDLILKEEQMENTELTDEQKAALAAKERAEIMDRCAKAGSTKGLTEEERAKVANEPAFAELCESERRQAKEAMLARNAKRIKELGGKLKAGETLEEYDTRMAKEKK